MSYSTLNRESEVPSMEATQIIDMMACIESQQISERQSYRNNRSISSGSSSSSRRRNQSLRKLLEEVKTKQQMDEQELFQQIPRNSNSQFPDFNELQRRLNELESKLKVLPEQQTILV